SNKEKVDKELFSLLVRMDECRKVASPPDKERMWGASLPDVEIFSEKRAGTEDGRWRLLS
ncbi:MAG: hypothetical protein V8R91_15140, partial [Butyricimonas faecihominis]